MLSDKKINCIRNSFFLISFFKSNLFHNQRKIIDSDFIQKDIFYLEKIFEDKLCLKIWKSHYVKSDDIDIFKVNNNKGKQSLEQTRQLYQI